MLYGDDLNNVDDVNCAPRFDSSLSLHADKRSNVDSHRATKGSEQSNTG